MPPRPDEEGDYDSGETLAFHEHARQTRVKPGAALAKALGSAGVTKATDADPTPAVDTSDLGAIIDLDSAEVCNLDAVAVRRAITEQVLGRSLYSQAIYPNKQGTITFLAYEDGQYKACPYDSGTHRAVVDVGYGKLTYIIEAPFVTKTKRLGGKKQVLDTSLETLQNLPITIAYRTDSGLVPLLKSIKTATGCHVVLPNGEELNVEQYNRAEVLHLLKNILTTSATLNKYNVNQDLMLILADLVNGSTDPNALRMFELVISQLSEGAPHTYEKNIIRQLQQIETANQKSYIKPAVDLRTSAKTEACESLLVVAQTRKGAFMVTVNGYKRESLVRLCKKVYTDVSTQLRTLEYCIRVGLDGSVYGKEQAIAYERFVCVGDNINAPTIYFVDADGTYQPLDDARRQEFDYLVELLEREAER